MTDECVLTAVETAGFLLKDGTLKRFISNKKRFIGDILVSKLQKEEEILLKRWRRFRRTEQF